MELDPLAWRVSRINQTGPILPLRGWILFSKIWGSHSHSTELPSSDVDYTGVYVAHPKDLLGLHPPSDTLAGEKPDYQIHELKKFCDLLIKGNPGIIEMLFTDRMMWFDPKWKPLYEARKKFLCHNVVKQYLGYSVAQLQRFRHSKPVHSKGGQAGEKWCYHMVRVAWDAERIALGGEPLVWKTGEEKAKLMAIRTGEMSTEDAVLEAETTIKRIDAKQWALPEKADEKFLNDWLLWIRGVTQA